MSMKMKETMELGTDFWNDSCDLKELSEAVETGAVGATSNPVIVYTAVDKDRETWMPVLEKLWSDSPRADERTITWALIAEAAKRAAAILEPVYNRTAGEKGYLSVQLDPERYNDIQKMVDQAGELSGLAPNIAIKAPATKLGIDAMEEMTARGIRVNATVSFTLPQILSVAEAIERGLKRYHGSMKLRPYITLMVGRLDDHLKRTAEAEGMEKASELDWAGIAVGKKAYGIMKERGYASSLLIAAFRHEGHWAELIGEGVIQTQPYAWWKKFNESDRSLKKTMDEPIAPTTLDYLLEHFEDFRRAYDENGMRPEEFESYGASVHTLNQFNQGYRKLLELVANAKR